MKLEIGLRFYHRKKWDYRVRVNGPLYCVITRVSYDTVFWRANHARSPSGTFPLADARDNVMSVWAGGLFVAGFDDFEKL